MNVVNKILLDINCQDERQARQLVAHWTPQLAEVLGEALSELCNRLDDPAKTLVIDRIELNVGNLTGESFSGILQQLKTGLLKSLFEQFNGNMPLPVHSPPTGARQSDAAPDANAASTPQTRRASARSIPASPLETHIPDKIHLMDTLDREEQAFYHFLLKGNLPWWQKPAGFSFDLILHDLMNRKPASLLETLRAAVSEHHYMATRLVRHATRDTLLNLFAALSLPESELQILIQPFFSDIQESVLYKKDAGPFLSEILRLALGFPSGNKTSNNALQDFLSARIKTPDRSPDEFPVFLKPFEDSTAARQSNTDVRQNVPEEIRLSGSLGAQPGTPNTDAYAFLSAFPQTPAETNEKYATEQAGLILLAGYLPYYFQQLGLRDEQGFVSEAAQIRAIHALNYLATARTDPPEYALALEKILCGLHPSTPVSFEMPVDADTLEKEANELLDSLIDRWSILKDTSKEAVRNTFLLRNGILERLSEREWALHVETGSFDILLNAFPAGISMSTIAFSWSKFILYVNWERP